ncbi:MAG: flavin reductase [Xanthomarina sp.]|mgnify:FL=1|jgi:flavin reductase (DIM6/NTAB) family NADH-FMN oxidoreductase RutF|uniref:flavin reductase family protein n=1 Tax=Xanthomarina TaxID=1868329 RepID=UPI000C430F2C|nr:flavin reductase family protein [Xanthomarina sp.]MAL22210.1 flavin reductase [Xanthomarina sp.]MBF60748.1 flavin reductase [Xanthomarina sp.]MCB0388692.1 flavin reductase family protein [Winogradskyella sp.]HAI18370.1 flavin reductase [Xanthomarina gelatinilytica]|tara:strand:+ start:1564 stop:2433 length:870 start_codon:yes stop_codon:yes gene_type:complete
MTSFEPKDLSVGKLHGYLLSAVAPRPIAFASTMDNNGNPNLSPFSFFNVFSANPPILIFSPARRVRNNTTKHTLENILATKEVVINVVNFDMVHQASLSSTEYPEGVNEFDKAGLTMLKSDLVSPFRVAESPIQFECKVNEVVALGDQGGAGNLVICEVVKLHIEDDILDAEGSIDQEKLDLVARAGGNYYSRARSGFFELPKPLSTLGIGVDSFPEDVKNSMILTGNDLGMLANVDTLPTPEEVSKFVETVSQRYPDITTASHREKHKLAHNYLSFGDIQSAWKILLS